MKVVSSNSTSYHGEIDGILLAFKNILSTQSEVSANLIHIFSDSIAAINALTLLYPQEMHHEKIEEIILNFSNLNITQNEEEDRLAKVRVQAAWAKYQENRNKLSNSQSQKTKQLKIHLNTPSKVPA